MNSAAPLPARTDAPLAWTEAAAYQGVVSRDARFDGLFFVGVTSTGIYCRPICRVRTPQARNCRFFATPAQAEAAAFRPCMKCRPEIAPGRPTAWSVMDASRTLAQQAAAWLEAQLAEGAAPGVAALAQRLGVSERHLRRIFLAEHGVTPLQYAQTRRLLLAKQLLTDSSLPVAQVAWASGFRSLRRFNAAFAEHYRFNPTQLRARVRPARRIDASSPAPEEDGAALLHLAYRLPFDHPGLLRFLAQRAIPGVEQVELSADGGRVRRSVRAGTLGPTAGWLELRFVPDKSMVAVRYSASLVADSAAVVRAVRRWCDLDASPQAMHSTLAELPAPEGTRLPGGLDAFELTVRAVLGQQVTVAAARTLARRLVERFGAVLPTPWPDVTRTFPAPGELAGAALSDVAALGIIRTRAAALIELARDWDGLGEVLAPGTPPDRLIAALCDRPGIGPWTAHYIAMRVLGWPDAFPPRDVAVLKAMGLHDGSAASVRAAEARAEAWRPWRAYAVLRLWQSLESPTP